MCQLSVFRNASIQTWREDSAGQEDADRCLKVWILPESSHGLEYYIPAKKLSEPAFSVVSMQKQWGSIQCSLAMVRYEGSERKGCG